MVQYGDAGGSNLGGFQTLYHVNSAGQATPYGHVATRTQQPGRDTVFGDVGGFTANQAGTEFAFNTYSRGGGCGGVDPAQLLDTATGTVTTPSTPAGGGPGGWLVQGMWFDRTGTPYASLVPNLSTCTTTGAQPAAEYASGYAPIVCKLVGGAWVKTSSGVFRVGYGPGNWLAERTGTTGQAGATPSTMTISGGTSPVTLTNVTAFAWAPSQS